MRDLMTEAPPRRPHVRPQPQPDPDRVRVRCAVLIASKDGEATIGDTVASVIDQASVYVVSDGSRDRTAEVAEEHGATVLALTTNIGKPAALHRAAHELGLLDRYDIISILDDDTTVAPDFMRRCAQRFVNEPDTAIVVGKTITHWHDGLKWNPWVATRAYAYWRYQVLIRRGQDMFKVLNCISGSNSVYRSSLLRQVLVPQTPYIVDDTFWTLETQRRGLGRIVYEPDAHAYIQDPTTGREWYKQNLRWMWGTFQGIVGHKVLRRTTRFDFLYGFLILDWLGYALLWPLLFLVLMSMTSPLWVFGGLVVGYTAWITAGAIALRKWRLIPLIPAIIAIDILYRINFVHAAVKTFKQPTVESCVWESPTRFENKAKA